MSRRGARLTVAVLFALSVGAAAWQYLRAERALASHHSQLAAFERDARAAGVSIADTRAAQQAYVAIGQGTDYWTTRVSASLDSLRVRLTALRQQAQSPEAGARIDAALVALDDFARMDRRARDYAVSGQRLLASDVIFADGFEMSQAVVAELDAARASELPHRARLAGAIESRKRLLAAGTSGLGIFFMLILAFAAGTRPVKGDFAQDVASEPADDLSGLTLTLDAPRAPFPAVDLPAAAALCADLARVTDPREIHVLLDRAARILDASGIILWIADPDGRELIPTAAHGYTGAALARMGTIPGDADNATAAAYREGKVHTVKGDVLTSGAIVAPLVTPGKCAGVMAAEVRHEREQSEDVRAVAAIMAAQLAMLVGAAPAAAPRAKAN